MAAQAGGQILLWFWEQIKLAAIFSFGGALFLKALEDEKQSSSLDFWSGFVG